MFLLCKIRFLNSVWKYSHSFVSFRFRIRMICVVEMPLMKQTCIFTHTKKSSNNNKIWCNHSNVPENTDIYNIEYYNIIKCMIRRCEKRVYSHFRNVYPFPQSVWLNRCHFDSHSALAVWLLTYTCTSSSPPPPPPIISKHLYIYIYQIYYYLP